MASTYYGNGYFNPVPEVSEAGSPVIVPFAFTVATALIINDLIKLAPIKALTGIYLLNWVLTLPDLDTGSPAWTFDLGDNTTADKFVANSTLGQAAANVNSFGSAAVVGSLPVGYTANNDFVLKVHTAPATGPTAVTIKGYYSYSIVGVGPALF